jgi:hypothetical protein
VNWSSGRRLALANPCACFLEPSHGPPRALSHLSCGAERRRARQNCSRPRGPTGAEIPRTSATQAIEAAVHGDEVEQITMLASGGVGPFAGGAFDERDPRLAPAFPRRRSSPPSSILCRRTGRLPRPRIVAAGGLAYWHEEPRLVHSYLRARPTVARACEAFTRIVGGDRRARARALAFRGALICHHGIPHINRGFPNIGPSRADL